MSGEYVCMYKWHVWIHIHVCMSVVCVYVGAVCVWVQIYTYEFI